MELPDEALAPVRLRQAVLVTHDLDTVAGTIGHELDLPAAFIDPGVGEFGLENRVFEAGSDFVEVLTPTREGAVAALDPSVMAHRWGELLGVAPDAGAVIRLPEAGQELRFVGLGSDRRADEGIVAIGLRLGRRPHEFTAGGVRFEVEPAS